MVEPSETIFEEREELMVSPFGGKSNFRIAHFLRPLVSIAEPLPRLSLPSPPVIPFTTSASRVQFKGWQRPQKKWRTWIESLHSKYHSVWKKAGIYEAIMGSKYLFHRHIDLIVGLAEKWCLETNTFIFPWGEATITLEDMMVLGGYSVLEDPVSCPTQKMLDFENDLLEARKVVASHYSWLKHFMGSGGDLEHLAFLSLWLSKFVFPSCRIYRKEKRVFNTAIRLAKGTRLALAPAVLSSIYGELGLLKQKLMDSTRLQKDEEVLYIFASFQLVQLWAWERFPVLRPNPNPISKGEPRSARWHKLKYVNFDQNIRSAIECAGECFQWRPYAMALENWLPPKYYQDKEQWVSVDSSLDKDFKSFVRCLRLSMLVGLDHIQQYLPHRVAMQFGMDQDIPACVPHHQTQNAQLAWNNYNRSIAASKIYIPQRLVESDVTTLYLQWWKQSVLGQKDSIRSYVRRPKDSAGLSTHHVGKKEDDLVFVPPGFSQKCHQIEVNKEDNNDSVSPGFSQEYHKLEVKASSEGNENVSELMSANNAAYNMELVMKPATKMMQRIGSVAGQENAVSDTIESEEGHLTSTRISIRDLNGIDSRFSILKVLEVDLEARISRLEGALDDLKAERLAHKFDKKTAKDGVSNM